MAHGKGFLKAKNYEIVGEWQEGKLQGFGICTLSNSKVFEGNIVNGEPNGFSTYTNNNFKFQGNFKNG